VAWRYWENAGLFPKVSERFQARSAHCTRQVGAAIFAQADDIDWACFQNSPTLKAVFHFFRGVKHGHRFAAKALEADAR